MARDRTGRAINTGESFWHIVDSAGNVLVVFERALFGLIAHGSQVRYVDIDNDGIAEDVRSVAEIDRALRDAVGPDIRFGWGARKRSADFLMATSASGEAAADAAKAELRKIANAAQGSDGIISLAMLNENGIVVD